MEAITIYDVAKRAGVSASTVSRALNSPDVVTPATLQRIMTVVDELGFIPKSEAAARARKTVGRIGVLAPFFTYPSFVQRLHGVAQALAGEAYELVIYNVESAERRDYYLATLPINRRLDGLIVMALPFEERAVARLLRHGLETILIEHTHPAFNSIEIDDYHGGALVAEYLIAQGHRRCGFVGDADVPNYAIQTSAKRLKGFKETLEQAGIGLPNSYIRFAAHGLHQATEQAHRLLHLPHPPTAIFAPSDTQAMGILKAAQERGISIPSDLAVIGFDDLPIAEFIGLTTVRQPLEESGSFAVEMVLNRLAKRMQVVQHVKLMLSLVQRKTA
jgi:DNA-binding LacI/PurR family transcriptional regulator